MVRVNAVKIIQLERRQKPRPRRANFLPSFLQGAQRGPQIRILSRGSGLDFGEGRQRLGRLQIVHHAEIFVEIGEDQHRQFQPAAIHFQFRFLQVALLAAGTGSGP